MTSRPRPRGPSGTILPKSSDLRKPFGTRDPTQMREVASRIVFGKRAHPPELAPSFRRERLRIISAEPNLLFAYHV